MRKTRIWWVRGACALASATALLRVGAACNLGSSASPTNGGSANPPSLGDAAGTTDAPLPCAQIPLPDGAPVHVTGMVREATDAAAGADADAAAVLGKAIANAMIAIEYGGLDLPWCDLTTASPYYVFGALTDDAGWFELDVKEGPLGVHSFADDYLSTGAPLEARVGTSSNNVVLVMNPLPFIDGGAEAGTIKQPQPTVKDAGLDKTTAKPGEMVTFSATLASWDADATGKRKTDPLSDKSILVEATNSWCIQLNPPSVGSPPKGPDGKTAEFPDGLWKQTFPAPSTPGTYTYWFSATTGRRSVTSKLISATLTVVP